MVGFIYFLNCFLLRFRLYNRLFRLLLLLFWEILGIRHSESLLLFACLYVC